MEDFQKQYFEVKFNSVHKEIKNVHEKVKLSLDHIKETQIQNTKRIEKLEAETRVSRFFTKYPKIGGVALLGFIGTNIVSLILLIKKFI